jgi:capsular polysaccharide biosynthesis protein
MSDSPVDRVSETEETAPQRQARTLGGIVTLSLPVLAAALIGGLIAGGIGASFVLRQPKKFLASTVTVLEQPSVFTGSGEGVVAKLSALRATYGILAKTHTITAGVAKRTGFPEGIVARAIDVAAPGQSQILLVAATTRNPLASQKIADAAAAELSAYVKARQDAFKVPAKDQLALTVAAPAAPGHLVEPTRRRALEIGGFAGVLGLVVMYLLADALRTRRAARRRR